MTADKARAHEILNIQVRVFTSGEWTHDEIHHAIRYGLGAYDVPLPKWDERNLYRSATLGEIINIETEGAE